MIEQVRNLLATSESAARGDGLVSAIAHFHRPSEDM
jgi:hypothetical protein